jgi:peroxiredoxin
MILMYRLLFALIFIFSLIIYPSCNNNSEEEKSDIKVQSIEDKAPDFVLSDLEENRVKLSDYKGKEVLLVFGTTWCPYCRAEIPHLKKIHSQYKERGLEIINIFIQEGKKKVSAYASKHELPYKVLLDVDGRIAQGYSVRGVPTKFLISKDGDILCRACRSIDVLLDILYSL